MVKMKLGEVNLCVRILEKFIENDLPIKTAWRLNKIFKVLIDEFNEIENFREKLIRQYGDEMQMEDGSIALKVKEENAEVYMEKLNEFLNEEVELNIDPVSIEDIGDSINLSVANAQLLSKILKD